jgi:type III restriction enzyme
MDHPATAHDINVLTVVANESYEDFVKGLQSDIHDGLSERPREANEAYFNGKILTGAAEDGADVTVTPAMARQIDFYGSSAKSVGELRLR